MADTPPPFGDRDPDRLGADVAYRGRAEGHDYVVRVRHRFLDTSCTVEVDGVEHRPRKGRTSATHPEDGLRFTIDESFARLRLTVQRPDVAGVHHDREVVEVRTAGLGGAGEVDVVQELRRTPLAPESGSPSEARDRRRAAHPTRSALLAALTRAAGYLLPLLGVGLLFSGLLRPLRERVAALLAPVIDRIEAVLAWSGEQVRPVREAIAEVTAPVREAVAAVVRPVREGIAWLLDLLLGWIPDLLPGLPDWVPDVLVPALVVIAVFVLTLRRVRRRREQLEAAHGGEAEGGGRADAPVRAVAHDPAAEEEGRRRRDAGDAGTE